jgi:hypothetical protein
VEDVAHCTGPSCAPGPTKGRRGWTPYAGETQRCVRPGVAKDPGSAMIYPIKMSTTGEYYVRTAEEPHHTLTFTLWHADKMSRTPSSPFSKL